MAMDGYRDRRDAGVALAAALEVYRVQQPLVLGVPRGGVSVAAEVAEAFDCDLDVAVARKVGAPGNPELAMGAVGADGVPLLDDLLIGRLGVDAERVDAEVEAQTAEARRRELAYRAEGPAPDPAGRTVIVVDDGVATGATLRAALGLVRRRRPARLCCAVPVGPRETLARLTEEADHVVCPLRPRWFMAVGEWYRDFRQVSDDEVMVLLAAARRRRAS